MWVSAVLLIVALAVALILVGCGGDDPVVDQPGSGETAAGAPDPGLQHIHGLGVRGDTLYIATHTGLWTVPAGQMQAHRVGASRQDIMGFSIPAEGRLVGSGHPDPNQAELPPNLGLIESRDGGRNWKNVSLSGEADFHVLESAGRQIYGVNSADGALMASADGGRSWQRRPPTPAIFSLAVDPQSSQHVIASTERGIVRSADAGKGWRPVRTDLAGLLAWPAPERLYLVGGDGVVELSPDGGSKWKPVGRIGGQPAAFIGHDEDLYAALVDGTVKRSSDGGRSWTLRATP